VMPGAQAAGGLRGRGGNMVPRMFDDLPECVKARKARDQQLSQ
jgi:hypothetical protein